MKISGANSRKLSQLVWRDRLRRLAPALIGAVALMSGAVAFNSYRAARSDPTLEVHTVAATILGLGKGQPARGGYIIRAQTADGLEVLALATTKVLPATGAHAVLAEARHKSGRLTYELLRTTD